MVETTITEPGSEGIEGTRNDVLGGSSGGTEPGPDGSEVRVVSLVSLGK